ncbi:hypothetical protein CRYUN_Cryun26dG0081200 [Craigia yunnanensis]
MKILSSMNDEMEDRYSVLIELVDQSAADGFYCSLNGKRFSPAEAELCHILFTHSVEYSELGEIASTPPVGFTELPTCPICLVSVSMIPERSFLFILIILLHLHLVCRFCQKKDEKPACSICGSLENLWVWLICGFMGCGRYKEGHAVRHWKDTQHCYSLELISQQIWDYNYESLLAEAKSKRDCSIAEAVEKAVTSEMQDIQSKLDKCTEEKNALAEINRNLIENQQVWCKKVKKIEEKYSLFHSQHMQLILRLPIIFEIVVPSVACLEASQLRLKDEKILDLDEQIRDLKVYIEAQKKLIDMTDSYSIRGGTLLPVPPSQSSTANTKRHKKSGRKRN